MQTITPAAAMLTVLATAFGHPPSEASHKVAQSPEGRAVAYLSREVPRWRAENGCSSCHNNGDGARALYVAMRFGRKLSAGVIEDTSRWLEQPDRWDENGGEQEFSDKRLARIQFTAALAEAVAAGQIRDRAALVRAAERLTRDQESDGSWPSDATGSIGSPVTYGRPLATALAIRTLKAADARRFQDQIANATGWIKRLEVRNTMEAAGKIIGWSQEGGNDRRELERAIEFLRTAQSPDGGWGPYATASPEVFDTAVVLVALTPIASQPDLQAIVRRGRAYLLATQLLDGSWPETTRPSGAESYAQHISTTGWATMALMESASGRPAAVDHR